MPPYDIDADLAIPLTLFTIEALTNVYKYGFPREAGERNGFGQTRTCHAAGHMKLSVIDDGHRTARTADRCVAQSTGARLMVALAHQVGGEMSTRTRDDGGTIVEMVFPQNGNRSSGAGECERLQAPRAIRRAFTRPPAWVAISVCVRRDTKLLRSRR